VSDQYLLLSLCQLRLSAPCLYKSQSKTNKLILFTSHKCNKDIVRQMEIHRIFLHYKLRDLHHLCPKRKSMFVYRYVAPPGECYYSTLLYCDYFSSLGVVSHAFSVLCMYLMFRHHPHPLGYFCAKFCFLAATSIAELADGEKLHTQSPSLFDAPETEVLVLWNISSW